MAGLHSGALTVTTGVVDTIVQGITIIFESDDERETFMNNPFVEVELLGPMKP